MSIRFSLTLFLVLGLVSAVHAQFVDDTPEMKAPAPAGVEPVIPLNKDDPTYNLWKLRRDDLAEGRDPGPIAIQRYPGGFMPMGIPTFFRLPVALTTGDLEAGQVDVAMMGAYTDMGFGSTLTTTVVRHWVISSVTVRGSSG
jgi:agmatinase